MSTEFKWTDEMVIEFLHFTLEQSSTFQGRYTDLKQFKASKQPKPEWEITALKGYGEVYPLMAEGSDQYHTSSHTVSLKWALENDFEIYSVKRLSDQEVFSIGDMIEFHAVSEYLPIERFETIPFDENLMSAWNGPYGKGIQECKKQEKPILFITEDGVKIYHGDTYYHVNARFGVDEYGAHFEQTVVDGKYCFSIKEKAEAFRIMNQPLFSISDIHDEYKLTLTSIERWIEKAKDKLNPTT